MGSVGLVEVTAGCDADPDAVGRADAFFARLGYHREGSPTHRDSSSAVSSPNWSTRRAFAIGEGVAADVDTGTTLGLNYPRGPVARSQATGLPQLRAVLHALRSDSGRGEERYRLAPRLLYGDSL